MGLELDPVNFVAPTVPVLEELFQDRHIFDKDVDFLREGIFATPQTPWVKSPQEIKGCLASAVNSMFTCNVLSQCKTRLDLPGFASLYYFPPWHPIAQYRKSRPSMIIIPRSGLDFNGNVPHSFNRGARSDKAKQKALSAVRPLDMAIWRQKTARIFRSALFEANSTRVDGVYVVMARRVPTNLEALELVSRFLKMVSNSDLSWASRPSKAFVKNMGHLTHTLLQKKIQPPREFLEKRMWVK